MRKTLATIAAALCLPQTRGVPRAPVLTFTGDGGLGLTLAEIETELGTLPEGKPRWGARDGRRMPRALRGLIHSRADPARLKYHFPSVSTLGRPP